MTVAAFADHLWQSTLFAGVAGLATLALKSNRAAVRHALWLAASVKFLVPFAVLTALGAQFAPRLPALVTETEIVFVTSGVGQPSSPLVPFAAPMAATRGFPMPPTSMLVTIWLAGALMVFAVWLLRWRRVAAIARTATIISGGREVDALRTLERAAGIKRPIQLVASTASLEPGVFGFARPVLVWPRAIGERLDEPHIAAILAHEVSHVRRRDNLTAAMHMVVEAVFWFHPLVWWLGARLVDERERACDEAVLRAGSEPRVYAESILQACRIYLESPLACVSGVTGSNLAKRIERITSNRLGAALTTWKKLLIGVLPAAAIVAPIVVGVLHGPRLRAESTSRFFDIRVAPPSAIQGGPQFEVASVKPNKSPIGKVMIQTLPGGRFTAENVTVRMLIRNAYQLQDVQLTGGPKWLDEDRFDIVAKTGDEQPGDPFEADKAGRPSRGQLMLRALLADRFKVVVHSEPRELPIYALVLAKKDGAFGPKLKRSEADCSAPDADTREPAASPGAPPRCGIRLFPGNMLAGGASMVQLAKTLANFAGRMVQDRTSLTGAFDFTLSWTPDAIPPGFDKKAGALRLPPIDANGPSLFTAVQDQLGLKLDPQKASVDMLIVDRAEHPTEN